MTDTGPEPSFAETFERLRLSRGWSPAEVARRLDVYPTEVSRWRHGRGGISIKNVRKVADLFEVDRDWLAQDDNSVRAAGSGSFLKPHQFGRLALQGFG